MAIKFDAMVELNYQDWIKIPDSPSQRDTARHAKKALKTNLKSDFATFVRTSAAHVIEDASIHKVDGHTRTFFWETGKLPKPQIVYVDWYLCDSHEDAAQLYKAFDNKFSSKDGQDASFSALKEAGLKLDSFLGEGKGISSALQLAREYSSIDGPRKADIAAMVLEYSEELLELDKLMPKRSEFNFPLIAAALLTFKKNKGEARIFWDRFIRGAGEKGINEYDSVMALTMKIKDLRLKKKGMAGFQGGRVLIRYVMKAFDRFVLKDNFSHPLHLSFKKYNEDEAEKWVIRK